MCLVSQPLWLQSQPYVLGLTVAVVAAGDSHGVSLVNGTKLGIEVDGPSHYKSGANRQHTSKMETSLYS